MSNFCVHLELPPYLAQWLIHWNGGEQPIVFPRLSTENKFLEEYLSTLPHNGKPDISTATSVAVAIPCFRLKPPEYYNYLPVAKKAQLVKLIRSRFIIVLWQELHRHGYIGARRDNLFYLFMKNHGIEPTETNWNAIAKIYQRQHKYYLTNNKGKK